MPVSVALAILGGIMSQNAVEDALSRHDPSIGPGRHKRLFELLRDANLVCAAQRVAALPEEPSVVVSPKVLGASLNPRRGE